MIVIALLYEADVGTMPNYHRRTNYNIQDTLLAQLFYHLNTVQHRSRLQMLARRQTNDCAGDNISPVVMLSVSDSLPHQ